jgi:hypothetical protein
MNKIMALSMLLLSACATASGSARDSMESAAGPWRGILTKGEARSEADFRFSEGTGGWQGFYLGRGLMPIALKNVQLGRSVHFEVPQMGIFDGTSSGETMEGEFRDESGQGTFRLEKELDWAHLAQPAQDDPRNAP